MLSATDLKSGMNGFTGTMEYHVWSILFGKRIVATDGAIWLAESAGAFWLLDAIASHQPRCLKDSMLRDMQFWTLKVNADKSAVLECERDSGDVAIRQGIPHTDFPLGEVKLWVERGETNAPCMVILLPSEH